MYERRIEYLCRHSGSVGQQLLEGNAGDGRPDQFGQVVSDRVLDPEASLIEQTHGCKGAEGRG